MKIKEKIFNCIQTKWNPQFLFCLEWCCRRAFIFEHTLLTCWVSYIRDRGSKCALSNSSAYRAKTAVFYQRDQWCESAVLSPPYDTGWHTASRWCGLHRGRDVPPFKLASISTFLFNSSIASDEPNSPVMWLITQVCLHLILQEKKKKKRGLSGDGPQRHVANVSKSQGFIALFSANVSQVTTFPHTSSHWHGHMGESVRERQGGDARVCVCHRHGFGVSWRHQWGRSLHTEPSFISVFIPQTDKTPENKHTWQAKRTQTVHFPGTATHTWGQVESQVCGDLGEAETFLWHPRIIGEAQLILCRLTEHRAKQLIFFRADLKTTEVTDFLRNCRFLNE